MAISEETLYAMRRILTKAKERHGLYPKYQDMEVDEILAEITADLEETEDDYRNRRQPDRSSNRPRSGERIDSRSMYGPDRGSADISPVIPAKASDEEGHDNRLGYDYGENSSEEQSHMIIANLLM